MGRWKTMRRWGLRIILVALVLAAILAGIGWAWERSEEAAFVKAEFEPPGKMVKAGDQDLHVVIEGQGSPGILLITGLGDDSRTWHKILDQLSESTRVVSYDRPGLGWSPPTSSERTLEAAMKDIEHLLSDPDLFDGPPILVGHSIGGMIARHYAHAHPNDISGLIGIDPTPDKMPRVAKVPAVFNRVGAWLASAGLFRWQYYQAHPDLTREEKLQRGHINASGARWRAVDHEMQGAMNSGPVLEPQEGLGDLPFTIFVASYEVPSFIRGAMAEINEVKRLMVEESTRSRLVELESDHYVHYDNPDTVVAETLKMVADVRLERATQAKTDSEH